MRGFAEQISATLRNLQVTVTETEQDKTVNLLVAELSLSQVRRGSIDKCSRSRSYCTNLLLPEDLHRDNEQERSRYD